MTDEVQIIGNSISSLCLMNLLPKKYVDEQYLECKIMRAKVPLIVKRAEDALLFLLLGDRWT